MEAKARILFRFKKFMKNSKEEAMSNRDIEKFRTDLWTAWRYGYIDPKNFPEKILDRTISNSKAGKVSKPIDLSKYEENATVGTYGSLGAKYDRQ